MEPKRWVLSNLRRPGSSEPRRMPGFLGFEPRKPGVQYLWLGIDEPSTAVLGINETQ
ncbi:hypothetical protein SLEP1_g15151 [Rubroshorea leprosula]|uniref:Uncharacterized protein n=1 Tax=Rubroshorea leprosula TaxID=152421 RepID=A0AAV5ISI8_9ROSI|nr:hypothetical protein SLEP1_g15151 [Rubroshorea leprosula]